MASFRTKATRGAQHMPHDALAGMIFVHVQELLPGGPCPEYTYRFKTHGHLSFISMKDAIQWWTEDGSKSTEWPKQSVNFPLTGWTGWNKDNMGLRLSSSPAPNNTNINQWSLQNYVQKQPVDAV